MCAHPLSLALIPLALIPLLASCGASEREVQAEREAAARAAREVALAEVGDLLARTVERTDRLAGAANRILSPMPVMTPAEEAALRRYLNASHVAQARAVGTRVANEDLRDSLVAEGVLVPLEDSTGHWIVRPGTSPAYVVPAVPVLLEELGTRFHARLAQLELPPYRFEVTSALRTSERQARLRGSNANAAAGVSSHEFGTTLDLSYSAFAPPARRPAELLADVPAELRAPVERLVDLAFESVSGRKSRELGAVFGAVLREVQDEGRVLVIHERQQTVWHVTVGG